MRLITTLPLAVSVPAPPVGPAEAQPKSTTTSPMAALAPSSRSLVGDGAYPIYNSNQPESLQPALLPMQLLLVLVVEMVAVLLGMGKEWAQPLVLWQQLPCPGRNDNPSTASHYRLSLPSVT